MQLNSLIEAALKEDIGSGDVSTQLVLKQDVETEARLIAKSDGIFFGVSIVNAVFNYFDASSIVDLRCKDGASFQSGECLALFRGSARIILQAERVMLNFLQRLCGIATTTHAYVTALNNPDIQILDTRKTTPLLRSLEKAAVAAGGGANHRFGLNDMLLLKENHLAYINQTIGLHQLGHLLKEFKTNHPELKIEIEVTSVDQINELDLSLADYIMFDNFQLDDIQKGIDACRNRAFAAQLEVSGNVRLDTIHQYRHLAIHRISVGALTHSVQAADLSLLFKEL